MAARESSEDPRSEATSVAAADLAGTNLADYLRFTARRRPADTAWVWHSPGGVRETGSWAQLDAEVDAAAAGLVKALGLQQADRVALALSNTPTFVTAYLAILRAGLVAVPLNTGYTAPEMARLLGQSDAKAVLCEDRTIHVAEEAVAETDRALVDPAGFDALVACGRSSGGAPPGAGGEDLAVLMFTSGTSGRPRGAMLTHRALRANLRQCGALDPPAISEKDVVLLVLPLFHIYGVGAGLGMVVRSGAPFVLAERFDPHETLALVRDEGVTNIPGAPPMYVAWTSEVEPSELAEGLRDVRLLVSGASPLPPAVIEALRTASGKAIHEGYGLTEAAPVVTSSLSSPVVKPGSVGRPVPGVEVRLIDMEGLEVVEDDPGEIVVRGDNLFSGYWPDGSDAPDPDGWFATGDVAYADGDGDLFLVDRRKELILVSGFNVYPREVEEAIAEHPDVAEAAVIAVAHPYTGEAVKAFVVPRAGATLGPQDVAAHCAQRLARFKRPTIVSIVDRLPHSATGKVAKGRLRGEVPAP